MLHLRSWLIIVAVIGACTCGGRTECGNRAQISYLTSIHDDPSCRKISSKGVLMYEAAKLLADIHNNKSSGFDIEITVSDTCGSITGALKAAMKALVLANINCLQPPHYLGIIGPDTTSNAEAVHKITSVLKVPHLVRRPSNSPYLHHLAKESDSYLIQGAIKVMQKLKWKSFTLVADAEKTENDVQHIAKKLTMSATEKGLCVLVHDKDEEDFTSHVVHIGKPEDDFFSGPVNATVLVISEGNLENHLNHVNSTNTILLLEDSRNGFAGLEERVEKSKWWSGNDEVGKYDAEELREVRWLEDAIEIYTRALDTLCKKKKCKSQINSIDWNNVVSNILAGHNAESQTATNSLDLSIKIKADALEKLASVNVKKNSVEIHWGEEEGDDEEEDENDKDDDDNEEADDDMPESFKKLLSKEEKQVRAGCATTMKEIKMLHEEDEEEAQVVVSEMDDAEWWTMVGTVSGVGVAMFVVGILAVYVVYTNIRGPRSPKASNRERDTSLRRVGSDRELPTTVRNQRSNRNAQRRDSNRSIRSNVSDKSV